MAILSTAEREALLQRATVIRDEIMHKANTANRVGSLFYDIVRSLGAMDLDELRQYFLCKDVDDETLHVLSMAEAWIKENASVDGDLSVGGNALIQGHTRIQQDLTFGTEGGQDDYIENVQGCKFYWNGSGWFISTDFLSVNKRMYARTIQVDEVLHVGGENLLTDASCIVDHVIENSNGRYYRVLFRKKDGEGRTIHNRFRKGDQAYCQIYNIDAGVTQNFANRYYWRLVVNTSNLEPNYTGNDEYHFIDLSMDIADISGDMRMDERATSVPQADDPIVQFGYRPTMDVQPNPLTPAEIAERQGATLISGGGKWKRSIVMWEGIKTFTLPEPKVKISPNGVNLTVDSLNVVTTGAGGAKEVKSIEQYIDANRSQFLIFETESTAVPTLSNEPYTSWTEEEKALYSTEPNNAVILNSDGRTWRFVHDEEQDSYAFEEFTDPWLLAQHQKIEDILDDNVITADEINDLKRMRAEITIEMDAIQTEFNAYDAEAKDDLELVYTVYMSAASTLASTIQGIVRLTPPVKLKESANDLTFDVDKTREAIRALFANYTGYRQIWSEVVRGYFSGKLEDSINEILDDSVITADEIKQIQLMYDQIEKEKASVDSEYAETVSDNASAVSSKKVAYDTAYNSLNKDESPEGYLYQILQKTLPIYLSDYTGTGVTKWSGVTRATINNAIKNYQQALLDWKTSYMKDYAQSHASITAGTIDERLGELLADFNRGDLTTQSAFRQLADKLWAVTNWVGVDAASFGSTGLLTNLTNLFVGTGAVTLEKDGNNIIYYDSSDRRIYSDTNGLYYLSDPDDPTSKVYYQDAEGKTPKEYGKPKIANISKAGLVTDVGFARLFVENIDNQGLVNAAKLLETGIDIEHRTIKFTADNLDVANNNGDKTMWLDDDGNLGTSGNVFTGMTIIDTSAKLNRYFPAETPSGTIWDDAESYEQTVYYKEGAKFYAVECDGGSLSRYIKRTTLLVPDIFSLSDVVNVQDVLTDGDNTQILLPFSVPRYYDGHYLVDLVRTFTKFKTNSGHLMTESDLYMLVGREFTFSTNQMGSAANKYYFHLPRIKQVENTDYYELDTNTDDGISTIQWGTNPTVTIRYERLPFRIPNDSGVGDSLYLIAEGVVPVLKSTGGRLLYGDMFIFNPPEEEEE